jgi:hypothetical protein
MSLRGGAEAIPCLCGEIATLPLVARNDNVIAFNAFVLLLNKGSVNIFLTT